MKRSINITRIILAIILITSLKFMGCEQEDMDFYIDCDYCMEEIPEYDTLWVNVTINDENPFVPLEFFTGNYDDDTADWTDTAYSELFWLVSEVGVMYSVKATYKQDGETVIAVDADKIKVVNGEGDCYSPCYYTRGGTLDVELK